MDAAERFHLTFPLFQGIFIYLDLMNTWEYVWMGREGNHERRGKQCSHCISTKWFHMQARLGLTCCCVFCSVVLGSHSTSTKLLFIYLKTCIPWKKMPQDSTVFLKLNPAGWKGEESTPIEPSAAATKLAVSLPPPAKYFPPSEFNAEPE